jgi:hypothetical protein
MQRIFDPSEGTGSNLVASASQDFTWVREQYLADEREREDSIRLRDMRALGFGQRSSVCG